jgi:NAD(P)-dependent dehydrogenase (short-subunit alcohol dehydrogenase family)
MNMRLKNKVAIVTGGGRGIGRGIARLFAKEGAKVVIAARTEDQLGRVVREIENDGGIATSIITVDSGLLRFHNPDNLYR